MVDKSPDVVGVGDVIIDRFLNLESVPNEVIEGWKAEEWFPEPGESLITEKNLDLGKYVEESIPGGRSSNQALAAYRAGADAAFAGRSAENVTGDLEEISYDLEVLSDEIADAYIFVDEEGENRVTSVKTDTLVDKEYIEAAASDGIFTDAEYVLVSNGESDAMLHNLFSNLEDYDLDVIFDPAPVDGAEEFFDYDSISYITPNEIEYSGLRESLEGLDKTVVKTSAEGVTVDGEYLTKSPDVDVVDTTGAGDVFNGYLAASLSDDYDLDDAVERACYAASISTTKHGAQPSIPEKQEIEDYLTE